MYLTEESYNGRGEVKIYKSKDGEVKEFKSIITKKEISHIDYIIKKIEKLLKGASYIKKLFIPKEVEQAVKLLKTLTN